MLLDDGKAVSSLRNNEASTPSISSRAAIRRIVPMSRYWRVRVTSSLRSELAANPVISSRQCVESRPVIHCVKQRARSGRVDRDDVFGCRHLLDCPEAFGRDLYQRERYGADGPISRDSNVVGINSGWNLIVESVAIERVRATDLIAPPRSSISVLSARTSSGLHEPPTGRRDVRGTDRAAHLSDEATPRKAPEKFLFLLTGNPHGAATPVRTARWPRICMRATGNQKYNATSVARSEGPNLPVIWRLANT
jgi:hypothetical protein